MSTILPRLSTAAFAFALLTSPALAAGMPSPISDDVAGSAGFPGSHSVTGTNATNIDATFGASDMAHSSAELPNNDAGTPINRGPDKVGAPRQLVPGNNMLEGGTHGVAGVNGGANVSAGATVRGQ